MSEMMINSTTPAIITNSAASARSQSPAHPGIKLFLVGLRSVRYGFQSRLSSPEAIAPASVWREQAQILASGRAGCFLSRAMICRQQQRFDIMIAGHGGGRSTLSGSVNGFCQCRMLNALENAPFIPWREQRLVMGNAALFNYAGTQDF